MTQALTDILRDIVYTTAGIFVASSLDLPKKLDMGKSMIGRNVSNGGIYFLVSEAIDQIATGTSKTTQMNYKGMVDDVAFFSAISTISEVSKLDDVFYDLSASVPMIDRKMAQNLSNGLVVSSARILGGYIKDNDLPVYVKMLREPTKLFA